MSAAPETVRVKATHPSQGEWVVINKADYDPQKHQLYEAGEKTVQPVPAKSAGKKKE